MVRFFKCIFLVLFFSCISIIAYAQSIKPFGISFCGNTLKNSNLSISSSAGQVVSGTIGNGAMKVNQGLLQEYKTDCITVISGTVIYQLGNLTNAHVLLFRADTSGSYPPRQITATNASGYYMFDSIPDGYYKIQVVPDTATYNITVMKTFYGNEFLWDSAAVITMVCGNTYDADIVAKYLAPLSTSNTGSISGKIIADSSYVGKTEIQGDPIPGVDVSIEQTPQGIIIATTQSKSDGTYKFNHVPSGTYKILVSVPGYTLDSTRTAVVGVDAVTLQNYVMSDSSIYPADLTTGILSTMKHQFFIYPNPFQNNVFVKTNEFPMQFNLYNVLGELVYQETIIHNLQQLEISKFNSGIYFYQIKTNNKSITGKLIKNQ